MPAKRKGGKKKMTVGAKRKPGEGPIPFPGRAKPWAAGAPKGKPYAARGKPKPGK